MVPACLSARWPRPALALAGLLLAASGGVGCDEPAAPVSALRVSPPGVDFGQVAVGASARRTVELTHAGNEALVVLGVDVDAALTDELRVVGVPERVAVGARREVVLIYAPRAPGPRLGVVRLRLEGVDPERAPVISVSARAVSRGVVFDPPAVDLGVVAVGAARFAEVQVALAGGSALGLTSVTVVGDVDFEAGADLPATLGPGRSLPIFVRVVATRPGPRAAELFVSDGQRVFGPVPLRATGLPAEVLLEPDVSDLGAVLVGDRKPHTVALSSRASTRTEVEVSARGAVDAFEGLEALVGRHTLEPGDDLRFALAFVPTRVGTASVTLGLRVGGGPEQLAGSLSGEGAADPRAALVFSPAVLDLGAVALDRPHRRAVWLHNEARVAQGSPGTPVVVAPGAEASLEVVGGPWPRLEAGARQRWTLSLEPHVAGRGHAQVTLGSAQLQVRYEAVAASVAAVAAPERVALGPLTGVPAVDRRVLEVESVGSAAAVLTTSIAGPDAARVFLGLPGVLPPGSRARLSVGALGTAPVRATLGLGVRGAGTTIVTVTLEGGPMAPRPGVPELCAAAGDPGVELHLVPLDATVRDVPRAASACNPTAHDSAGSTWVVGAPFGQEACALRLTGGPDDGGALAVFVTTPADLPAPTSVSVFLRGFTPLATRTMAAGQRWLVGHTEGDRVVVVDAPLDADVDLGCY